jgi:hypothetical protein
MIVSVATLLRWMGQHHDAPNCLRVADAIDAAVDRMLGNPATRTRSWRFDRMPGFRRARRKRVTSGAAAPDDDIARSVAALRRDIRVPAGEESLPLARVEWRQQPGTDCNRLDGVAKLSA